MIEFFHTKDRLRFLLYVGAIAAPLLLISAWVVSSMEESAAAKGEPNAQGGLSYRIQEKSGATTLPPPLAALLSVPPNTAMTDVDVTADSTGRLSSAAIKAFSTDGFKTVAAFHRPTLSVVTGDLAGGRARRLRDPDLARDQVLRQRSLQGPHEDRVLHQPREEAVAPTGACSSSLRCVGNNDQPQRCCA